MKKVLIICAGGMSSSMIASKAQEKLNNAGVDVQVDARGLSTGKRLLSDASYDMYLISPQTRMHLKQYEKIGQEVARKVLPIPPQAYVPVDAGINRLASLIKSEI